jgi:hypothetical protein
VVGKAGAEPAAGQEVTVTSGAGAPSGAGWVQAKTVYTRGDQIYVQRDTTAQPNPPAGPSVTITADDSNGWAEGHPSGLDNPTQGTWTGYGPWRGGWFYGHKIAQACAGRTVAGMTVQLVRSGQRHGYYSAQRPSIWVHDYATAPQGQLVLHDRTDPSHGLGLGEGYDYPLSGSQVSALAAGSMLGVGVYTGEYRTGYILFAPGSHVTITFA